MKERQRHVASTGDVGREAETTKKGGGKSAGLSLAETARIAENSDDTLDTLFHGRLRLYQSRRGYRVSLDSLLVAFFVTVHDGEKVIDLGSGNGAMALILAGLYPALSVVGVELQSGMVRRALRNIQLNRYQQRVSVVRGDVRAIERVAAAESFDVVVCNPPYRSSRSGRLSPDPEKTVARHEVEGTLDDFVAASAYLLTLKGRCAVVYHAARAVDLFQAMRSVNLEPKRVRMVHSFIDADASLVLVEAVKGARPGLQVLSPLVVYDTNRRYTAEIEGMLAGQFHKRRS